MGLRRTVVSRATVTHCSAPLTGTYFNTLQHTACCSTTLAATHYTHCNTLLTAIHCNTPLIASHCSLQLTATHCNSLYLTASHCNTYIATLCNTLQHTATHCNTHTATHCNTLQHTATHCCTQAYLKIMLATFGSPLNWSDEQVAQLQLTTTHHSLQHTATHCNTLQHTATHRRIST